MKTPIYAVVEVVNNKPCLTAYVKEEGAVTAFKQIVREQMDGCDKTPEQIEEVVAEAMKQTFFETGYGEFFVEVQKIDLVG